MGRVLGRFRAFGVQAGELRDHGLAGQGERGADVGAVVVGPRFEGHVVAARVVWWMPFDDLGALLFQRVHDGVDGSLDGRVRRHAPVVAEDGEREWLVLLGDGCSVASPRDPGQGSMLEGIPVPAFRLASRGIEKHLLVNQRVVKPGFAGEYGFDYQL